MMQLPNEEAVLHAGEADYIIPAGWTGERQIVSVCGWWMGTVCIGQDDDGRWLDWMQTWSLNLDD